MTEKVKFYKLALLYTYFNNGYSITSPIKWLILTYGATSQDLNTIPIFFLYLILCFLFGWIYLKSGFLLAMIEVNNRHNLLAKELRDSKILKDKK